MKARKMDIFLACVTLIMLTGMTTYFNLNEATRKNCIKTIVRFLRYLYEDMTGTSFRDNWD